MFKNYEDKLFLKVYRDFLEGEHILVSGDDGISYVHEFLNNVKKEHVRRISVIEDAMYFQQYGVGYYQGNLKSMEKEVFPLLEDVNRRRFVDRVILVDVLDRLDFDSYCVLKDIVKRRVQLIVLSVHANKMDKHESLYYEKITELMREVGVMPIKNRGSL